MNNKHNPKANDEFISEDLQREKQDTAKLE